MKDKYTNRMFDSSFSFQKFFHTGLRLVPIACYTRHCGQGEILSGSSAFPGGARKLGIFC